MFIIASQMSASLALLALAFLVAVGVWVWIQPDDAPDEPKTDEEKPDNPYDGGIPI